MENLSPYIIGTFPSWKSDKFCAFYDGYCTGLNLLGNRPSSFHEHGRMGCMEGAKLVIKLVFTLHSFSLFLICCLFFFILWKIEKERRLIHLIPLPILWLYGIAPAITALICANVLVENFSRLVNLRRRPVSSKPKRTKTVRYRTLWSSDFTEWAMKNHGTVSLKPHFSSLRAVYTDALWVVSDPYYTDIWLWVVAEPYTLSSLVL